MDSILSNACRLKLNNFEGPFDLLFHLIEKNKISIYDIPISQIADQYMDYLFAAEEFDMEIAGEFLMMAATLLHIKSRMLLPKKNTEDENEDVDPREELIIRLLEYKKYKNLVPYLKDNEKKWKGLYTKCMEVFDIEDELVHREYPIYMLIKSYSMMLKKNKMKVNNDSLNINKLMQREKVTVASKIKEIMSLIITRGKMIFNDVFTNKTRSRAEIVSGFLAMLELAGKRKVKIKQKTHFGNIEIFNDTRG